MMDQSRPAKAKLRKQKSAPLLAKINMETPSPDRHIDALLTSTVEPETGEASLPMGLKPMEAVFVLPNSEKDTLRKQAFVQAEQFEILGSRLVTQLSRVRREQHSFCGMDC
jgi:hypothetical protein